MAITTTQSARTILRGNPVDTQHQPDPGDLAVHLEELNQGAASSEELAVTDAAVAALTSRVVAVEAFDPGNPNPKEAVAVATTANVTLSGEQTIDGVTTANSRILVKDQTTPAQNGIYVTASGAWSRATDMDAAAEVRWARVYVNGGTLGAGLEYFTASAVTTLGTDAIAWKVAADSSGIAAAVAAATDPETVVAKYDEGTGRQVLVHPEYFRSTFHRHGAFQSGERHRGGVDIGNLGFRRAASGTYLHYATDARGNVLAARDRAGRNMAQARGQMFVHGGNAFVSTPSGMLQITSGGDCRHAAIYDGFAVLVFGDGTRVDVPLALDIAALNGDVTKVSVVPMYGQSNITGASSGSVLTPTATDPGRYLTAEYGPRPQGRRQISGDADNLAETYWLRWVDGYERLYGTTGETAASSFATEYLAGLPSTEAVFAINLGWGSADIGSLRKAGTAPQRYANIERALWHLRINLALAGIDVEVPGVVFNQGEGNMGAALGVWGALFEEIQTDIAALVARMNAVNASGHVPFAYPQVVKWTFENLNDQYWLALDQLQLHIDHPDKFALIGPAYNWAFAADETHYLAAAQVNQGARAAKAIAAVHGAGWTAQYATSAVRTGTSVVVTFTSPEGALTLDTTIVSDPGTYGITWADDSDSANVSGVAVTAANQVTLTLDATPTGANPKVRIALNAPNGQGTGQTKGFRSNLRGTSADTDKEGAEMHPWAQLQEITVTT